MALPAEPTDADEFDDALAAHLAILVVDDNVEAARSLAKVLEMMGHHVQCAFDGTTALQLFDDRTLDVVFLDIGLPDLSGYEVAARMRKKIGGDQVMLVALTGWGSEQHRRRSSEAGFDYHLAKPADAAVIRRILSRVGVP